jgi:hypothetical protein
LIDAEMQCRLDRTDQALGRPDGINLLLPYHDQSSNEIYRIVEKVRFWSGAREPPTAMSERAACAALLTSTRAADTNPIVGRVAQWRLMPRQPPT